MSGRMLYVHALSPIHIGSGQGAGVIDLPVIREKVTSFPYLPGSSIKGVLRDASLQRLGPLPDDPDDRKARLTTLVATYGPDTANASDHAGGIAFSDLHLLCLPVRSYLGTLVWVTCPFSVNRWLRDARHAGVPTTGVASQQLPQESASIYLPAGSAVVMTQAASQGQEATRKVWLEDLELTAVKGDLPKELPTAIGTAVGMTGEDLAFFLSHFGVVSDTTFGFLTRTAMEVTTRNSIDSERKVAKGTALWSEEAIPAESILAGPLLANPAPSTGLTDADLFQELEAARARTLQIGGNATIGRGLATVGIAPAALAGGQ